ncbi:uncharacterized protein METZ01_LOCUS395933, partial [marine metagenome]
VALVRVRQRARGGDYPEVPIFEVPLPEGAVFKARIFKTYDIRGQVPEEWDEDVSEAIGRGFANLVRRREPDTTAVVVGRDMRPSGVSLGEALARGITAEGLNVVDLGLASTDLVYFASGHLSAPAVVLTASHNPAGYNGMKCCLSGAAPLGYDNGLNEVEVEVEAEVGVAMRDAEMPVRELGTIRSLDLLDAFADHVRSFVDVDRLRPLRLVVDTANGMGGLVVPAVFEGLPFTVDYLYPELDGTFPNHPADPIQPENLRDLQTRVLAIGADLGLAFDGDADRVFLV